MRIAWFSAGVSSAVAIKLDIDNIDKIIYIDIDDQHPDSIRFVLDCERWFGKPIDIWKSELGSVERALLASGYVNSPYGSPCTVKLKKRLRKQWEKEHPEVASYVWGMDLSEKDRADRLKEAMPEYEHIFPLIEQNIGKKEAHQRLLASGIKRPKMYDLGYPNNNCIGCVKGGKGYWNKIKQDFPDVFEARAKMERVIGGSCLKDYFLDELPEEKGNMPSIIVDDCGIFCEYYNLNRGL